MTAALLACSGAARADELGVHATAGGGHAVSSPQNQRFGWGGGGTIGVSYGISPAFALQAEGGAMALGSSGGSGDPALAAHRTGTAFTGMVGARVRPFGASHVAGLWLDANGGFVETGDAQRPGFDAHLGYDVRAGDGRWDIGPFLGFTEIVQVQGPLAGGDARIAWLGLHVGFGAPAQPVRRDTDRDMVWDDEDACPSVPGVRTRIAATNGCPRADRDLDAIYDDEDACPREPGRRTSNPATNGCPRRDRDMDAIDDDDDACPDVKGERTRDRRTNGCPKVEAARMVRLEKSHIVLEERIHFAFDRAEVLEESHALVRAVADFMNDHPALTLIEIEGRADERGSEGYNLMLSMRRAQSVRALLVTHGVDPERLVARGMGEADGHDDDSYRENRRVEFVVVSDPRLTAAMTRMGAK